MACGRIASAVADRRAAISRLVNPGHACKIRSAQDHAEARVPVALGGRFEVAV